MSELERYGLAAVAVVIVAVLLISMNNPEPVSVKVPLPGGGSLTDPGKFDPQIGSAEDLRSMNEISPGERDLEPDFDFFSDTSDVVADQRLDSDEERGRVLTVIRPIPERTDSSRKALSGESAAGTSTGGLGPIVHEIARNETLGEIAKRYLGSSSAWRKIKSANPGLDERKLVPGQKIKIPSQHDRLARSEKERRMSVAKGSGSTYTVKRGDTLQKISKRFYGTHNRWKKIKEANQGRLKDSEQILPGMVLDIPPNS